MKTTLLHRSADRATVRLTPGWWGRLWGEQTADVELFYRDGIPSGWYAVGSRRPLEGLPRWPDIREALDFVPVVEPPRAAVDLRRYR